jgi:hypothetical protein
MAHRVSRGSSLQILMVCTPRQGRRYCRWQRRWNQELGIGSDKVTNIYSGGSYGNVGAYDVVVVDLTKPDGVMLRLVAEAHRRGIPVHGLYRRFWLSNQRANLPAYTTYRGWHRELDLFLAVRSSPIPAPQSA